MLLQLSILCCRHIPSIPSTSSTMATASSMEVHKSLVSAKSLPASPPSAVQSLAAPSSPILPILNSFLAYTHQSSGIYLSNWLSNSQIGQDSAFHSMTAEEDELPPRRVGFLLALSIFICALAITSPNDILRSRSQFKRWFPQFEAPFAFISQQNCTAPYDIYLYGTRNNTNVDVIGGGCSITIFVEPMITCIL